MCEFLGKPVPDVNFPHKNKGGSVADEMLEESPVFRVIKREMKISLATLTILSAVVTIYFVRF